MSIQSNELRIGNIFKGPSITGGDYCTVNGNTLHQIYMKKYEIEPEIITEEWLIKFGFIISNEEGKIFNKKYQMGYSRWFGVFQSNNYWIISICKSYEAKEYPDNFVNCGTIKHVHQLQNLYFALTNEELQINN